MSQTAGSNPQRITADDIDNSIRDIQYLNVGTLTVCVITMRNGFMVTGESASASPEAYSQEVGERLSRTRAKEKIWALLGYVLREKMHQNDEVDFKSRLIKERDDLWERVRKLDEFIAGEIFVTLPVEDRADLQAQSLAMKPYLTVLDQRVNRLCNPKKD